MNSAHLTAAKVQVQIAEVTVEGEALKQCPVVGRSIGPFYSSLTLPQLPWAASNSSPTQPEGLQGQPCG